MVWTQKAERLLARHKMELFPPGYPEWKWEMSQDVVKGLADEAGIVLQIRPDLTAYWQLFGYPVEVVEGQGQLRVKSR